MTRIKRGSKSIQKLKVMRLAKSYKGSSSKLWRSAKQKVNRALMNAYITRRLKKREYRRLWVKRISAVLQSIHPRLKYSEFIHYLKVQNIHVNRKIISQVAVYDRRSFEQIVYNFLQLRASN